MRDKELTTWLGLRLSGVIGTRKLDHGHFLKLECLKFKGKINLKVGELVEIQIL
jgi:hypothetical protein